MDLIGREPECKAIDQLLDVAREGLSGVLVLRGEAGIGKTALIDYAASAADDFLVVRFVGVEPERDLGFAALHRLLMPILHQIERLPAPQRDALNSALGLVAGPPANPFLVGLGVMTLAANAARARERLLCIIDDVQWVDWESVEALAFWGRRLQAARVHQHPEFPRGRPKRRMVIPGCASAMTLPASTRLSYDPPQMAWPGYGNGRETPCRSSIWVRRMGCRQ